MKFDNKKLETIISELESSIPQKIKQSSNHTFELKDDPTLLTNLSGQIGAFFVRAILRNLNVDEHYLFKWKLDNKYNQYKILSYYAPECMPLTYGLSELLHDTYGPEKILDLCKNSFFLKATIGFGSGRDKNFDRTTELNDIIDNYQKSPSEDEEWILQKKLVFDEEFRVHTFGRDIIYGLTFIFEGSDSTKSSGVESFLNEILKKLPDQILEGNLIGWDVGVTDNNEYFIIEANITGFHPKFHRGFQTSGFFGDANYGSIACAGLNNYFRYRYHVSIGSIENILLKYNTFYQEFMFYTQIMSDQYFKMLRTAKQDANSAVIIYFGDDANRLFLVLLNFLVMISCTKKYYLVMTKQLSQRMPAIHSDTVEVIIENTLYTKDQYEKIMQLSLPQHKQECCTHVVRIVKETVHFIA